MPTWILLVLLESLSLVALVHVWLRRSDPVPRRLAWSAAILVPLLGPLAYAAAYRLPAAEEGIQSSTLHE